MRISDYAPVKASESFAHIILLKFGFFGKGVVSLRAPMGQNSQNIQCHCEPVTDVTGVAIPLIFKYFQS